MKKSQSAAAKPKSAPKKPAEVPYTRRRKIFNRALSAIIIIELGTLVYIGGTWLWHQRWAKVKKPDASIGQVKTTTEPAGGRIVTTEPASSFTTTETEALIRQTDKNFSSPIQYGMTKQVFAYTSSDPRDNSTITVYGRVYVPSGGVTSTKLPVIAFAPGTTGIADQCAASLEQPAKHNWANYDSLLAAYVSQGYVVVTTDYEGMRDTNRLHHYMVGEAEGRAVLDSIRAAKNLPLTRAVVDMNRLTLAGYSQGGHAALWADKIRAQYASEITVRGLVGFGPVTSVSQTLADTTRGSTIAWFGPLVMVSYSDYYHHTYPVTTMLQARFAQNLTADVTNNCIDNFFHVWGQSAASVFTPDFYSALKNNTLAGGYAQFGRDLATNTAANDDTSTPKLINQGGQDNVILPTDTQAFVRNACSKNSNITFREYKTATHYNTMVTSFTDTLAWLQQADSGRATSNCSS